MKNTNWDADDAPQNDWRNDETNEWLSAPSTDDKELRSAEPPHYSTADERLHTSASNDDPDEDEEDEVDANDEEEETAGDWGHVDPAGGNSPFPDSNEPSSPGSAV